MRAGLPYVALLAGLGIGCGSIPATLEFVDIAPAETRLGDITTVRFRATDSRG